MMISRKPRIIRQNRLDSVPRLWLYVHDKNTSSHTGRTSTMARTTTRKTSKTAIRETDLTALLTQIATTELVGVDTLETQGSDSLDFVEVSVWSLKDALTAAFIAGQQAAASGQTEIAWEGGEVEIIEFTQEGKHATGIRLPNDWEAKAWIAAHENEGCYAFRPTKR